MQFRPLGRTGLELSQLSFGASSLGQEFRTVDLQEAILSVRTALELGMNFIDTSPFYGRGMSEVLLGVALEGVPRQPGKPTAVVARTVKGKGVSFMEDTVLWHYRSPEGEELERALAEVESGR